MKHQPDDQLSKAHVKATEQMLAQYKAQRARLDATIDVLTDILVRRAGVSQNGNSPEPQASEADIKRTVERARARFAARKPQTERRTAEQWDTAIVQFITDRGEPTSAPEIGKALGYHSSAFYNRINEALRRRVIVKAGILPRNGYTKAMPLYGLPGRKRKPAARASGQPKRWISKLAKAQRERSAAVLRRFSHDEARPWTEHPGKIGKLISNGYLKRSGEKGAYAYTLTDKEFQAVNPIFKRTENP